MRSTNQTSGHQTSNHQPSSAGLLLFECATRIEGVQPTRSSAGLLLIECATRIEGVQPTTVCGSASFGAQAISTRLSCCQLGPRNWQIHIHRAQGVRFATDTRTLLLSPVPGPKLLKSLGPETGLRRVRFCYSGQHTSFHHELSAAIAHWIQQQPSSAGLGEPSCVPLRRCRRFSHF